MYKEVHFLAMASMPLLKWSFLNRFFASLLQIGEADNKELRGFLRYVGTGEVTTEYTRRIDDMIRTIKVSEQMRKEYRILPAVIMDAIDEGVERGKSLGIAEGEAKGRSEGSRQAKLETAKNLLNFGLSRENIAKATGLSQVEVEAIK